METAFVSLAGMIAFRKITAGCLGASIALLGACHSQWESLGDQGDAIDSRVAATKISSAGDLLRVSTIDPEGKLLLARKGMPIQWSFSAPGDPAFAGRASTDWNVTHADVRTAHGWKHRLDLSQVRATGAVDYVPEAPGFLAMQYCVGPHGSDAPDAWRNATHCSVTHVGVVDDNGVLRGQDSGLSDKIGLPIEIRPYQTPYRLRAGDDLPVRVYLHGRGVAGAKVEAMHPDGNRSEHVANDQGVAVVPISRTGRWTLHVAVPDPSAGRTVKYSELVFDTFRDATLPVVSGGAQ